MQGYAPLPPLSLHNDPWMSVNPSKNPLGRFMQLYNPKYFSMILNTENMYFESRWTT